eukprot:3945691-Prymnesium_polylepis.1
MTPHVIDGAVATVVAAAEPIACIVADAVSHHRSHAPTDSRGAGRKLTRPCETGAWGTKRETRRDGVQAVRITAVGTVMTPRAQKRSIVALTVLGGATRIDAQAWW